jgi:hypothetical protein
MTPFDSVERLQLEQRMKSGANWFYWIAALSLVTSVISLAGGTWGFFISLGVTQLIDAVATGVASQWGWGFKAVALAFDLVAAGLFALIGYFGNQRKAGVLLAGMVLYALDALLFVVFFHLLALAFHAFALYSMYGGYRAAAALAELDPAEGERLLAAGVPTWRAVGHALAGQAVTARLHHDSAPYGVGYLVADWVPA